MEVICGQGPAPAGATLKHYKNLGLDLVPGTGLLATVIPGAFDAWMLMLRDHGTLSLAEVFEPALHYASQGIPVLERIQKTISYVQQLFREEWPSSAEVFLPGNEVPEVKQLLCNPVLAKSGPGSFVNPKLFPEVVKTKLIRPGKPFIRGLLRKPWSVSA